MQSVVAHHESGTCIVVLSNTVIIRNPVHVSTSFKPVVNNNRNLFQQSYKREYLMIIFVISHRNHML